MFYLGLGKSVRKVLCFQRFPKIPVEIQLRIVSIAQLAPRLYGELFHVDLFSYIQCLCYKKEHL